MIVDVLMPKMGESIMEGTIVEWKKNVGDMIAKDETLLEISTDKVDSEIPCSTEGTVLELLFNKNDTVEVNTIIARIGTENSDSLDSNLKGSISDDKQDSDKEIKGNKQTVESPIEKAPESKKDRVFYSPLVKSIAKKEDISLDELSFIKGSGNGGRVNKSDILNYIQSKPNILKSVDISQPAATSTDYTTSNQLKDSIEEMDRVRVKIAEHMVNSKNISAHVYTTSEVDVTNIVNIRNYKKDSFLDKNNIKLTYTPIIVSACIKAIQEYPLMNASIDETNIVHHQNINMGIAVALPDNNLIVPVIKAAEEKNFLGLSRSIDSYAKKARSNSLAVDDIFGSTFTVTNPGIFGGLFGMPIINQPNVGILSIGSIEKRPIVKETEYGDAVFIRYMLYLTLGYDHRLIDGAYGTKFLSRIKQLLENYNETEII
jgi:2-oxoglutarate dehydrogenase E2 component (dihydrolipoamide succinyltransferase)